MLSLSEPDTTALRSNRALQIDRNDVDDEDEDDGDYDAAEKDDDDDGNEGTMRSTKSSCADWGRGSGALLL